VKIFGELEEQGRLDFNWRDVFEIFKKPNVSKEKVHFPKLDEGKIREILVKRHEFSDERVQNQFDKLREIKEQSKQKTLF
jgi:hypothetical protein